MSGGIPPGNQIFMEKCLVRCAIEEANTPFTCISANLLAGIFLACLAQLLTFFPSRDHVNIYGKGIWVAEQDVAMYTAVDDPRAENMVLYIRPPANILTQTEVINIWEKLLGKVLIKTFILSPQDWLLNIEKCPPFGNLDFRPEGLFGLDTNDLYPEYKYVSVEEYLQCFI